MNITLTVTRKAASSVASVAQMFDTSLMRNTKAKSSTTIFQYPSTNGIPGAWDEYEVSESFAAVQALSGSQPVGVMKAVWGRFDATGGTKVAGTYNLVDPVTGVDIVIPDKSIILDGFTHIKTTFASGTNAATMSLGLPTDAVAGLKAAIAISNGAAPWTAGKVAIIPVGTVATAVGPITADRKVNVTVAVETLTAGIMDVLILYVTKPN